MSDSQYARCALCALQRLAGFPDGLGLCLVHRAMADVIGPEIVAPGLGDLLEGVARLPRRLDRWPPMHGLTAALEAAISEQGAHSCVALLPWPPDALAALSDAHGDATDDQRGAHGIITLRRAARYGPEDGTRCTTCPNGLCLPFASLPPAAATGRAKGIRMMRKQSSRHLDRSS